MKAIAFITILLLLSWAIPASAYTLPADHLPSVGDVVTAADGSAYEITGECTVMPPGSGNFPASQILEYGFIPCKPFIAEDGGWVNFLSNGAFDDSDPCEFEEFFDCAWCKYEDFFYCPGQPSTSTQTPLDLGKAISFLLGGLTGIGFVMASSLRW